MHLNAPLTDSLKATLEKVAPWLLEAVSNIKEEKPVQKQTPTENKQGKDNKEGKKECKKQENKKCDSKDVCKSNENKIKDMSVHK